MSSKTELLGQQRAWALKHGLEPDDRGYLADFRANLFRPMSGSAKDAFQRGSGSELLDTPTRPAKMKALHSSSALAVNFFDYWVFEERSALRHALELDREIESIAFEAQYPTGLTGNPPNLDVALELSGGYVIAIESKYSEWMTTKPRRQEPFKSKYFPIGRELWKERGLPESQRLAAMMSQGDVRFRYLDVPQLLKHSLGLANALGDQFSLYYTFLDWPGEESLLHFEELHRFSELVGEELRFRAIPYNDLLAALSEFQGVETEYIDYLKSRYFGHEP